MVFSVLILPFTTVYSAKNFTVRMSPGSSAPKVKSGRALDATKSMSISAKMWSLSHITTCGRMISRTPSCAAARNSFISLWPVRTPLPLIICVSVAKYFSIRPRSSPELKSCT